MEKLNVPVTGLKVHNLNIYNWYKDEEPKLEVVFKLLSPNGKEIAEYKCSTSKHNVMNYPAVEATDRIRNAVKELISALEQTGVSIVTSEFNMIEAGKNKDEE